ncbi:Prophage CP4-57 regulatory protein (AlpA) [Gimesia aquarii]|uniref:Prophage CP4-57 regulatory protein (AlpA) n=2 Tax=Gimesia aquarii TaxID=2527964 RepID=A0A517VXM8_9PLAN|nr:Prophage CP4-57 regulatory protein (AlpA) [Gimesia aquarii]
MNDNVKLIDRRQLASKLGISIRTLQRWLSSGKIPKPIYLGSGRRLPRWILSTIDQWIISSCPSVKDSNIERK